METLKPILLIAGFIILIGGYLAYVLPWAIRKGLNVSGLLQATTLTLNAADGVIDAVKEVVPDFEAIDIVDNIIAWGKKAADAAEQLYNSQQLPKDGRKAKARDIVLDMLLTAKIELTPEIERIVDGMIEAGVLILPHGSQTTEVE